MDIFANVTSLGGNFVRIEKERYIEHYRTEFVASVGDLAVVSDVHNPANSLSRAKTAAFASYPGPKTLASIIYADDACSALRPEWGGGDVAYYMGATVEEKMQTPIQPIRHSHHHPLQSGEAGQHGFRRLEAQSSHPGTLGDAVSSFLEILDTFTEAICLATKSDILSQRWRQDGIPTAYNSSRNYWFKAASWRRWA
ncbi:MAG: hypothetical protein M1839_005388, partial [Geoglossum umbratile]